MRRQAQHPIDAKPLLQQERLHGSKATDPITATRSNIVKRQSLGSWQFFFEKPEPLVFSHALFSVLSIGIFRVPARSLFGFRHRRVAVPTFPTFPA